MNIIMRWSYAIEILPSIKYRVQRGRRDEEEEEEEEDEEEEEERIC